MTGVTVEHGKAATHLSLRKATDEDLELCIRFRIECGWGEERLVRNWGHPDKPLCIFMLGEEPVGMGGWYLDLPDPQDASRETSTVQLTALYISKQAQGGGLGRQAMDLLEKAAIELYGAKTLTLDTIAYLSGFENGVWTEDTSSPSMPKLWYERRGYKEYKPVKPQYPMPEAPGQLKTACFLRRSVA